MTPIQLDLDWRKSLLLDLKVQPSSLFIAPDVPEKAEGGEEGEGGAEDIVEMNWHCKSGLATNIQLVKKEFEKKRDLRPVKVFVTGPPCSGKTFFSNQLGEHYNVPHIHAEKLISDLLGWDQEKEDNYKKACVDRDRKVKELTDLRAKEKAAAEKKAKLEAEAKRKKAIEDAEANGEEPPAEVAEQPPAEEGEDGAEKPQPPKEEPIVVKLDIDSDDEF